MKRDKVRIARIREALAAASMDAVVCALPANVLLLSGYWPVIGSAVAVATCEGAVAVVAPDDEAELASEGWADVMHTFRAGSLESLTTVHDAVRQPLAAANTALGIRAGATVGFEAGGFFDPSGYASRFVYGAGMGPLLHEILPGVTLSDATDCLVRL